MLETLLSGTYANGISILLIFILTLCASAISAVFGIGGGLLQLVALSTLLPPVALIPIHAVVQCGSNLFRATLLRNHIQFHLLVPFALGTSLGSMLSGLMFIRFPEWLVQYGIAGFIVLSVAGGLPPIRRTQIYIAGAITGFFTMWFGATGPLVVAFLKNFKLLPTQLVATHASLMTLQHAIKVVVFAALGFMFSSYSTLLVYLLVASFLGSWLGKSIHIKTEQKILKRGINIILLLLAFRLAWQATTALRENIVV